MKYITLFALTILMFSCHTPKNAMSKVSPDGTWIPVRQEIGGNELPKTYYVSQTLVIKGDQYILTAESVDKGETKTDRNKMDIYGKEGVNKDKHFTAIWKLENGELTICYNLKGDGYPEEFSTKDHPLYFLSVFTRKP